MAEVKSKVPGIVDEIKIQTGDRVEKGQIVMVLEAMKMKMPVAAIEAGIIGALSLVVGDRVNPGVVLFTINPE
ncbi:Biotin/lipoyl attachment protein [Yersinia frederiksenii]|nr:Biotin/lipoyl attachment protein [Yersinia frederiksenii]CNK05136.1 Biotin/lipoyl attachment protein [Yersinia frederiksenii]